MTADQEIEALRAEVAKWKKAATDTAFTAERALARLIVAEKVCEAAENCDGFFGNTPKNRQALSEALDAWRDRVAPN